jgi:small subunit ribosomal protein S6e
MAVFKFVIAENGKCYQLEKDQKTCEQIVGMKIGNKFPGDVIGLEGYQLKITGGTDKDGFPMNKSVDGIVKKKILATKGHCFSGMKRDGKILKEISGIRRKKTIRGNVVDRNTVQINTKVLKSGAKSLEELVPKKEKKE